MRDADSNRAWLAVLIILAAAALVRFWGLDFGLPHPWSRPDESRIVNMAIKFGQGDLEPPFFNYPTLYPYLMSIIYGVYFAVGRLFGLYNSVNDFAVEFATDPTNFYLLSRAVSAIFGTLTVLIVFRIGERLVNRRTAFIASVFLAFTFLHVRDSHFGVTDVPMTFFIMAAMLYILRIGDTGRMKHYILAGLMAGLAASTKYAGVMLAFPLLAAHLKVMGESGERTTPLAVIKRPGLFMVMMLAAFLLGTPYAALKFSRFAADLSSEMSHLDSGHMGIILSRGWWHHLRFNLFYGLGWPLLIAALAGIVLLLKRDWRKALVFLLFPIFYYLWAGKGYTVFARYMLPVIPFLCIAGAVAMESLRRVVAGRSSRMTASVIVWVLAVLVLLPSLNRIGHLDRLLSRTDNRIVATDWVLANIPAGTSIYQIDSGIHALQLDPGQYFLQTVDRYRDLAGDRSTDRHPKGSVWNLVDSLAASRRYRQWLYDPDVREFSFDGVVQDSFPRYIITEQVPLKYYSVMPEEISRLLEESYDCVYRFIAFDTTANNYYDLQDHFYLPLSGFGGVSRPGPNLYIYELKSQSI